MVVVAEGNQNGNAFEIAEKLKEKHPEYESKVTIIGHLQRGGAPTCHDRVLASRLGFHAIDELLKGSKNVALGIVDDELVMTPFEEAITKSKAPKQSIIDIAHILST